MKLEGKIGIITGGGQGIGKAIASRLAADGETVVIADLENSSGAKTADELKTAGFKALFIPTDVTNSSEVELLMKKTCENFGEISTLVTCAGIIPPIMPFEDIPEELFDKVLAVNLKGTFLCIKSAIPYLKQKRSGSIICIASRAGFRVGMKNVSYGSSKAAVVMLAQHAAKELAEFGIRVNILAPGLTEVGSIDNVVRKHLESTLLLGSLVNPDEIATAASMLASDDFPHMTGGVFSIDGGQNL